MTLLNLDLGIWPHMVNFFGPAADLASRRAAFVAPSGASFCEHMFPLLAREVSSQEIRSRCRATLSPYWGPCLGHCFQTFDTGGVFAGDTLPMLTSRRIVSTAADSGCAAFWGGPRPLPRQARRPRFTSRNNLRKPRPTRGLVPVARPTCGPVPAGSHLLLRHLVAAVARFRETGKL